MALSPLVIAGGLGEQNTYVCWKHSSVESGTLEHEEVHTFLLVLVWRGSLFPVLFLDVG